MTAIMVYHIRSKYTAVGRKEIVMFFYLYMLCTFMEMFLVTGIIPISSPVYPVTINNNKNNYKSYMHHFIHYIY